MSRPSYTASMRGSVYALAWLAGVAVQLQQARLWSAQWLAVLALAALALLLFGLLRARRARIVSVALACALLAFSSTSWRAHVQLDAALSAPLEGQDLVVTGVVAALPQLGVTGTRFLFDVESAALRGQTVSVPALISLGWYSGFDGDALLAAPPQELRAGQRWRLTVRLRQNHGSLNPHGFDLELWLFEQGIGAGGTVRASPGAVNVLLAENVGHVIERARQQVRDAILLRVADRTAAGVLAALAIGDQAAIEREDWDIFRATGVAHLMSISGLHVTMFAWLAGGVVGWLWRRSTRLMLLTPAPTAARWGGLVLAAGYALLAGWGVPAQRTVWMIAAVVALRSAGVRWPQPLVLLVAAWVVCLFDPWAMLQAGFWLSFFAVAMLISSEPVHASSVDQANVPDDSGGPSVASHGQRLWHVLREGLRTQAIATVGLAPLSMVFFQQVSLVGFAANLVAIPLVTLLITPLALLGIVLPLLWTLAAALVQGLMALLGVLAALPMAVWSAAAAPAWAAVCGLVGGALLVMPLPWRLRLWGLPLMLPLLVPPLHWPAHGQFEAVAVDIGQGTAVLVRTRSHLLVYDSGPVYSPESDAGQRVLLPLLRARGEQAIDLLMLSHRDSDHVGGAASLLKHARVLAMSSSLEPEHRLLAGPTSHTSCAAGQQWDWDGVHFDVLHPLAADSGTRIKPNALSCVLRVQAMSSVDGAGQGASLLLTGDIEAAQEAALLQRQRGADSSAIGGTAASLRSDILLVPHHGSRTSSTGEFIAAVAPRVALVQAAYRSRYGHPAPDVVQRYIDRGIVVVRSDRCGAWTRRDDGIASCERATSARYWHHRMVGDGP